MYNTEKYLKKCLDSIVTQDNGKIEVVLVNDGSKDDSDKICKEYCEKYNYITYIKKENGGVSSARNVGIEKASGDYLWFIDSDDYISAGAIETIFKKSKSDCDLYEYGYKIIGDNPQKVKKEHTFINVTASGLGYVFKDYILTDKISRSACNKIFKADIIKTHNLLFDGQISMGEDFLFVTEFIKFTGTVELVAKEFYCYYQNPASAMHKKDYKTYYDMIRLSERFTAVYSGVLIKDYIDAFNFKQFIFTLNRLKTVIDQKERATKMAEYFEKIFTSGMSKNAVGLFLSTENASFKGRARIKLMVWSLNKKHKKIFGRLI